MSSIMIMPDQIYNDFNLLDEGEGEGEVDMVVGGGVKSPITMTAQMQKVAQVPARK
jgi:hypothetical protein